MRVAGLDAPGDDGADHGDDRADRQIDALGADHHGHAKRDQRRRACRDTATSMTLTEQAALRRCGSLKKSGETMSVDDQDRSPAPSAARWLDARR